MTTPQPVTEDDLLSFVDNEVDDPKREAVTAHLATAPHDAARVEAWRQQNILLRTAFAQVLLEPVPPGLSAASVPRLVALPSRASGGSAARRAFSRRLQRRSLAFTTAAFVAGICVALAASFSVSRYTNLANQNAASSRGPALALIATAALHQQTASMPQSVLTAAAGSVEPVLAILPYLRGEGLDLRRGNVRGKPEEPANCLDFNDAAHAPVVLCIAAAKSPFNDDFQSLAVYSTNSVYWHEAASLYALAAPYNNERLIALARHIHAALAPAP